MDEINQMKDDMNKKDKEWKREKEVLKKKIKNMEEYIEIENRKAIKNKVEQLTNETFKIKWKLKKHLKLGEKSNDSKKLSHILEERT